MRLCRGATSDGSRGFQPTDSDDEQMIRRGATIERVCSTKRNGWPIAERWFNRRSATTLVCRFANRGLKPTATFVRSLRDQNTDGRGATSATIAKNFDDRALFCGGGVQADDIDGGVGVAGDEVAVVVGEGEFVDSAGEGQAFFDDSAGEMDDLHSGGGSVLPERGRQTTTIGRERDGSRERMAQCGRVAERHPMVAVGFNSRIWTTNKSFVAERRLNRPR